MGKTNAELPDHAWFALVDAEHCRLLCCRLTEQGTPHVDEYDAIENTFPEREHLRPKHEIDRLVIFAPPRMLGELRKASSQLLAGHLKELEGNLMRLDAGQLAEHPMVRDLVPGTNEA
jgi:hypothetical protein